MAFAITSGVACSSGDDASLDEVGSTPTGPAEARDDELFTASGGDPSGDAGAQPEGTVASANSEAPGATVTADASASTDATGTDVAAVSTADPTPTEAGRTDSDGSPSGADDVGSVVQDDPDQADGGSGPDRSDIDAAGSDSPDIGVVLGAGDLLDAGLDGDWKGTVEVVAGSTAGDTFCDLSRITAIDHVVSVLIDEGGDEFEQVVAEGSGDVGVGLIDRLPECDEFVSQFGDDARDLDPSPPPGARDATGWAVDTAAGTLTWLAADVGGTFVGVFHIGPASDSAAVVAAFELLTTRVDR